MRHINLCNYLKNIIMGPIQNAITNQSVSRITQPAARWRHVGNTRSGRRDGPFAATTPRRWFLRHAPSVRREGKDDEAPFAPSFYPLGHRVMTAQNVCAVSAP